MPLRVGYRRAVAYDSGLLGRAEVVSAGKGAVRKVGPGVDNPPGSKNELLNCPCTRDRGGGEGGIRPFRPLCRAYQKLVFARFSTGVPPRWFSFRRRGNYAGDGYTGQPEYPCTSPTDAAIPRLTWIKKRRAGAAHTANFSFRQ